MDKQAVDDQMKEIFKILPSYKKLRKTKKRDILFLIIRWALAELEELEK